MTEKTIAKTFGRYSVAGVTSTVVQFFTLTVFVESLYLNPTFSSASGFIIGSMVHYLMLYYWTFQANGRHQEVVVRYLSVTTFTLLLNVLFFWFLTEVLHSWYLFSQVFATCSVSLINFLCNRNYTFY